MLKKFGIQHSTLSEIERGIGSITERTIIAICSIYNVNEEWLKTGNGEMFNTIDKKYHEFFAIFNELSPVLQDFLIKIGKDLKDIQNKI